MENENDIGYEWIGSGTIRHNGKEPAHIDTITVRISPDEILLRVDKTPATPFLIDAAFRPLHGLEIQVKVDGFLYVVKGAIINKATLSAKKDDIVYLKDIKILAVQIDKILSNASTTRA
ncbi:hypothetical protein COS86_04015 [Candidatus Bathyarchaeota archaeon CG07_land_8_20_14_0_80_47_9]|nr:MAG: hypothetical protein COS86_04015 [Candidatus Bathyarchaeota archaeon CG07_land_8_20_14_0_80_47_9]